jgi:Phosphotransferase enzyme family
MSQVTAAATEHSMEPAAIDRNTLTRYLSKVALGTVELIAMRPLDTETAVIDPKGFGYGVPFEIDCLVDGVPRAYVVSRTKPARGFGHDYPADRAWQALWAHTAYNTFPRHARSRDVGLIRASGELVSAADAVEFFQLVEKADGTPYWLDLERLLSAPMEERDVERVEALARFLADAHTVKRDEPTLYQRRLRELVGHGECLMGILESYPHPYPLLPVEVCEELERQAIAWRWRLRSRAHRLSRVHGDFHPWNLLFREGTDFSALDRSRGDWGEPADDVAALGINYLFYGLRKQNATTTPGGAEPFSYLLRTFIEIYLKASGDSELCEVMPPFLAFRALVIAHPRWYPALPPQIRSVLIQFARRLMTGATFCPGDVNDFFASAR